MELALSLGHDTPKPFSYLEKSQKNFGTDLGFCLAAGKSESYGGAAIIMEVDSDNGVLQRKQSLYKSLDESFEIQKEVYRGQQYSQIYFARLHLTRTLLYSLLPTWKPHLSVGAMEKYTMKDRIAKKMAEVRLAREHTLDKASPSSHHSTRPRGSASTPEVTNTPIEQSEEVAPNPPAFFPEPSVNQKQTQQSTTQVFQSAITQCCTLFESLVTNAQKSSDLSAALEKAQEENLACISFLKDEISTWRSTTESYLKRIEDLTEQNKNLKEEKHKAKIQIDNLMEQNKILANEKHVAARQAVREFRQSKAEKS